ncbi:PIN domain nuclease [Nocardioides sp.]|uniref:PIN domain nuclease n=1 Tax=Nocardioides sp. TaxID=35761 RepID=UPI0039E5BCB7
MSVTYDAGALVAGERNDRKMWALHAALLDLEISPNVPAPALAQAWRGGSRQASLARMLKQCHVEHMTEAQALAIGAVLAASGTADVVDAAVVESARRLGHTVIVTSDPGDLGSIAAALGFEVTLEVP